MKVALIPPIPNLGQAYVTRFHLTLAQLYVHKPYFDFYEERSKAGDFVVIDNGAHEGPAVGIKELLRLAREIHANEVVIPDVHQDEGATMSYLKGTLEGLAKTDDYEQAGKPRLMLVPQVSPDSSAAHYAVVTGRMLEMCGDYSFHLGIPLDHFTIGVPLMYDFLPTGLLGIVDRLSWLTDYAGAHLHLLGWSRKMSTPIRIAEHFPTAVRSIDTCKPFVYARHASCFDVGLPEVPKYPGRPDDYFTQSMTPEELAIGNYNAKVCELCVRTQLPTLPESGLSSDMPEARR